MDFQWNRKMAAWRRLAGSLWLSLAFSPLPSSTKMTTTAVVGAVVRSPLGKRTIGSSEPSLELLVSHRSSGAKMAAVAF